MIPIVNSIEDLTDVTLAIEDTEEDGDVSPVAMFSLYRSTKKVRCKRQHLCQAITITNRTSMFYSPNTIFVSALSYMNYSLHVK